MLTQQNQTDPKWLDKSDPDKKGTGLFVIADVSTVEPDAITTVVIENITYKQCVGHGYLAIAFKWVPHNIATLQQMRGAPPCDGEDCVYTCVENGCMCINFKCRRIV